MIFSSILHLLHLHYLETYTEAGYDWSRLSNALINEPIRRGFPGLRGHSRNTWVIAGFDVVAVDPDWLACHYQNIMAGVSLPKRNGRDGQQALLSSSHSRRLFGLFLLSCHISMLLFFIRGQRCKTPCSSLGCFTVFVLWPMLLLKNRHLI